MLSRRNIRIKILESIYSYTLNDGKTKKDAVNDYYDSIENSFQLLLFVLKDMLKIAKFSVEDKKFRAQKYIRKKEDENFQDWLWNNDLTQALKGAGLSSKQKESYMLEMDDDLVKKLYRDFAKEEYYPDYAQMQKPNEKEHRFILLELFKFLLRSEVYMDYASGVFVNSDTDKSHVKGTGKKVIKALPANPTYFKKCYPDDETCEEFGLSLIQYYLDHHQELEESIKNQLDNWDLDRVALIDLICIKLALSELFIFENIPIKVTINEYLELVKTYSTEKSNEFLNGVLDNLVTKYVKEGKIKKTGRGLIE